MSTKHLRTKLRQKEEREAEDESSDDDDVVPVQPPKKNAFALLSDLTGDDQSDENTDEVDTTTVSAANVVSNKTSAKSAKKNKKKAKKRQQKKAENETQPDEEEDFDDVLKKYGCRSESGNVDSSAPAEHSVFAETDLFKVDFRRCDPEAEMRAILGAKFKVSDSSGASSHRRRLKVGTRMVMPRTNWAPFKGIGLSMKITREQGGGIKVFEFVHGAQYKEAQHLFWAAADSFDHNAFGEILRVHPYHVDTLMQMATVFRTNEDWMTARSLIERAVFACEASLHSQFNLATFNCRLDYRKWENRPYFLALFRHINGLCQRSCFKTAIEFCKALYSLDPSDDPLGVMMMIDYVAIRARMYDYLITLADTLDVSRNILELPNFAYSTALAIFMQHQNTAADSEQSKLLLTRADVALRRALLKFPTVLPALLDVCGVEPDKKVDKCAAFSYAEQTGDGKGLQQLIKLFVSRNKDLWIDRPVLAWLERNVTEAIPDLDANADLYTTYKEKRQRHYARIPRAVLRHILVADITPSVTMLDTPEPHQLGFDYDPLPPSDSYADYTRPSAHRPRGQDGLLTAFFRSLLPNYDMEALALQQEADAAAAAARGEDPEQPNMGQNVRQMLDAVRNMLQQVQFELPPGAEEQMQNDDFNPADWDDVD